MLDGDPFENGTPKYNSATDIYDALQVMATGEEIGILSDMFSDVSWEGQDYYYTDNGSKLIERWEEMTDYGNSMWLMDVAVWQLSDEDANEWIYQILCNDDLAKRIGFKKVFVDTVLSGMSSRYKAVSEAFADELGDLDRFDFRTNSTALMAAMEAAGYRVIMNPYQYLSSTVYSKLKGLRLDEERQLIVDSRAMLFAYDDFMYGLKSNQYLYNQQEHQYQQKCAKLQASYDNAVKYLIESAAAQGIVLQLPDAPLLLAASDADERKEEPADEPQT